MTIDHTNQPVDPGAEPVEDLAARVDAGMPPPPGPAEPVESAEGPRRRFRLAPPAPQLRSVRGGWGVGWSGCARLI